MQGMYEERRFIKTKKGEYTYSICGDLLHNVRPRYERSEGFYYARSCDRGVTWDIFHTHKSGEICFISMLKGALQDVLALLDIYNSKPGQQEYVRSNTDSED